MIRGQILKNLEKSVKKLGIEAVALDIDSPANSAHGDYSTSVALKLTKQLKKNPLEIAEEVKKNFPKTDFVEKIDIVKPGFINFWISKDYFLDYAQKVAEDRHELPSYYLGENKKIMVEFAHPNTHKLFHIGHLRNISTGEAIVRIYRAVGNKVIAVNYQGDVGLHIAKCLWGVKKNESKIKSLKSLKEKIKFIGRMYTEGTKAYEENEKAKEEILKINEMIYEEDPKIMPLWKETRQWSLDYFDAVYKRVDTKFERFYFESEFYKRGVEICEKALKDGTLERSQGAIVFNGKRYGLDTRVFINSKGFPTYEGKELALAEKEFSEFGEIDKNIHVVTPEQTSFFKITFKVQELIDEKKYKNKQRHLIYEWVKLKTGKMSSREGNIIEGNWLIDQTKEKILREFECDEETAETLAVASVKYSFLKQGTDSPIAFDIEESVAVDGNSGPYLVYTYVRCKSVLAKAGVTEYNSVKSIPGAEEKNLLRKLHQFAEIVPKAAENFSPSLIANYLYELSSQFNLFYQKSPILKAEKEMKELRLLLTSATANTIKKGLELLGIKTVDKM